MTLVPSMSYLEYCTSLRLRSPLGGRVSDPQVPSGTGYPGGNRGAPPRGVDVKQPLAGAPGGSQGPGRALRVPGTGDRGPVPETSSGQVRRAPAPGGGAGNPARTGSRGPGPGRARGFYINPSRRPPAVPGRGPGVPGSRGVPEGPGEPPGRSRNPAPAGEPRNPSFPGPGEPRGPGARG